MSFTLPDDDKRVIIIGRTGSGKTQAGIWLLSLRSFDQMPWIIIDFKGDALIGEIGAKEISLTNSVPSKPGLYVVRPLPHEEAELDNLLWRIWKRENVGIFIDEGFMTRKSDALAAILTQGRSKYIPVIMLTQRPVWLNRFAFSESDYKQVFALDDRKDYKVVQDFFPYPLYKNPPPRFWSYWYDVAQGEVFKLQPVPDRDTILSAFVKRTGKRKVKL